MANIGFKPTIIGLWHTLEPRNTAPEKTGQPVPTLFWSVGWRQLILYLLLSNIIGPINLGGWNSCFAWSTKGLLKSFWESTFIPKAVRDMTSIVKAPKYLNKMTTNYFQNTSLTVRSTKLPHASRNHLLQWIWFNAFEHFFSCCIRLDVAEKKAKVTQIYLWNSLTVFSVYR